jgi:hypothetical protein
MKYSKSGVKLPIIRPVIDIQRLGRYLKGKIIAGCENVNGIFFNLYVEK